MGSFLPTPEPDGRYRFVPANSAVAVASTVAASVYGQKEITIAGVASGSNTAVADGTVGVVVPASMNGMNLVAAVVAVYAPGTTGTTDFQLRRSRAGTDVDMLSTKLTVDSGEYSSATAAAAAVIDATKDDVATGDIIFLDCDAVASTEATGSFATLTFATP